MPIILPFAKGLNLANEVFAMMDVGEVAMAPMISGYVLSALKEHPDIGFSFPTEPGPVLVRDMLCLVKDSPEPELAKMFAEKALGVANQTDYAEQIFFRLVDELRRFYRALLVAVFVWVHEERYSFMRFLHSLLV